MITCHSSTRLVESGGRIEKVGRPRSIASLFSLRREATTYCRNPAGASNGTPLLNGRSYQLRNHDDDKREAPEHGSGRPFQGSRGFRDVRRTTVLLRLFEDEG